MPAIKCDNGKWKWGETGSCKYETQTEAETDNEDYYEEKNNNELEKGKEKSKETIKEGEKLGENIKIWDKKYNNEIMEKRVFNIESRVDTDENEKQIVVGHASVYNSRSENLGGFYEYIQEGAFTNDLIEKSDVRALINHDPNLILARSTSGTLKLAGHEKGLRYEFPIPDTSYGRDLAINLENKNITQSSFAFTVAEDKWSTDAEGRDIRTITKIDRLYDISSVTYPAYSAAESDLVVAKRGLAIYKDKQELEQEDNFLVKRSLAKLKIELAKRK